MADENRNYEIFNLNDIAAEFPPDPESKARHRAEILVKSDTLRVVLVTSLTGGKLNEHSAPGPITIHVLKGRFVVDIEGDVRDMGENDIAIVAPGVRHAVECVEDGDFLLTIAHLSHVPDTGGDA